MRTAAFARADDARRAGIAQRKTAADEGLGGKALVRKLVSAKAGWIVGGATAATLVAVCGWLVVTDAAAYRFLGRLYVDKRFLKHTLREWGILAPVIFAGLQALQVVVSPIPGQLTGILGGYLFGLWGGFLYSTIGLTLGSLAAFAAGRWLGSRYIQRLVSPDIWQRLGFIVEAEGAILCFIIFLIPGLPKDVTCYLFGLSPMPFWVFAVLSALGRIPDTWVVSAQGAQVASGDYTQMIFLTAIAVAVALPLYYYRNRVVAWVRGTQG
jgi:uncharacterized membrane protein YdjX (TVP38/TMEM64 family)